MCASWSEASPKSELPLVCAHWASRSTSVTLSASLSWYWFPWRIYSFIYFHACLLLSFCSCKLWFSVSTYLSSQFWGAAVFPVASLRTLSCGFSVCSAFLVLLLGMMTSKPFRCKTESWKLFAPIIITSQIQSMWSVRQTNNHVDL